MDEDTLETGSSRNNPFYNQITGDDEGELIHMVNTSSRHGSEDITNPFGIPTGIHHRETSFIDPHSLKLQTKARH